MKTLGELIAIANGLHALIGVIIFFGGLIILIADVAMQAVRRQRSPSVWVNNVHIDHLHIHVGQPPPHRATPDPPVGTLPRESSEPAQARLPRSLEDPYG